MVVVVAVVRWAFGEDWAEVEKVRVQFAKIAVCVLFPDAEMGRASSLDQALSLFWLHWLAGGHVIGRPVCDLEIRRVVFPLLLTLSYQHAKVQSAIVVSKFDPNDTNWKVNMQDTTHRHAI